MEKPSRDFSSPPTLPGESRSTGWLFGNGRLSEKKTVIGQINLFTGTGGSFASTDLVTIWAGANDFFFGVTDPSGPASNIVTAVSLVSSAGAEHVLVLNLPDPGETPDIQAMGPASVAGMSALVNGFNAAQAVGAPEPSGSLLVLGSCLLVLSQRRRSAA